MSRARSIFICLVISTGTIAHATNECEFDLTERIPFEVIDRASEASAAVHALVPTRPSAALLGVTGVPSARAVLVGQTVVRGRGLERAVFSRLGSVDTLFTRLIEARDAVRARHRALAKSIRRATGVTTAFARFGHLTDHARPVRNFVLGRQSWLSPDDKRMILSADATRVLVVLRERRAALVTEATEVETRAERLDTRVSEVLERVRTLGAPPKTAT